MNPKQVWARSLGLGAADCKYAEAAWLQGTHRCTATSSGTYSPTPFPGMTTRIRRCCLTQPTLVGVPKTTELR